MKSEIAQKWHYWGQWKSPLLINTPWSCFGESRIFREWSVFNGQIGDEVTYDGHFFTLKSDLDATKETILKAFDGANDFFHTLETWCMSEEERMLALEGKNDLEAYFTQMVNSVGCSIVIHYVNFILEPYLQEKCSEDGIPYSEITALMQPHEKTLHQLYEEELRIVDENSLSELVEKYKWIGTFLYVGDPLTVEKAAEEKKALPQKSAAQTTVEIPKGFESVVRHGSRIAYWRTRNGEIFNKVALSYRDALAAFGKSHGIEYAQVIQMTHKEIIAALHGAPVPQDIAKRDDSWGLKYESGELSVLSSDEARKRLQETKILDIEKTSEVKGMIACKGIVRGIARVVLNYADQHKVQKGDVLIAPETTPDFVPCMKLASAFVTNQGGVTSHAAIVAREMKKPCIIGTKIATEVFKDGDMVEVDANKGIVRKI